MISSTLQWLERRSPTVLALLAVATTLVFGAVDYLTGWEVSFAVFYLLPISLASWFVNRRLGLLLAALSALTWLVADLSAGIAYSNPLLPWWNTAARIALFGALATAVSALRRVLVHERTLARVDPLTGLRNQRAFYEQAELHLERIARFRRPLTLAYLDIDGFKKINDTLGHRAGDEILVAVAHTLERNVRAVDVVARLGGDEFAVILPHAGPDQARIALQRIRRKLLEAAGRESWPVTFSVGAVTCTEVPESVQQVLDRADALMYSVKASGKNNIRYTVLPRQPAVLPVPAAP